MYCVWWNCLFLLSQNPQADLQAQDRCHRIGQTKPVVVYRLVTANSIDQKILERASNKRKLEQMVIHKSKLLHICQKNKCAIEQPQYYWCDASWSSKIYFTWLMSSADKFKGGKSELNQSKGGIDLNELMELLKTRRSEWYEMLQFWTNYEKWIFFSRD